MARPQRPRERNVESWILSRSSHVGSHVQTLTPMSTAMAHFQRNDVGSYKCRDKIGGPAAIGEYEWSAHERPEAVPSS